MTGRTAVVLAGGRSGRFGSQDKALAEVAGTPMLAEVLNRVGTVTDHVIVSCRAEQQESFEQLTFEPSVRYVHDPGPDSGPVAGLAEALPAVETPTVSVVACDMPGVDPSFLALLFGRLERNDNTDLPVAAIVPRQEDGTHQPLQAAYRTDWLGRAVDAELAEGDQRLHGLLERLPTLSIPPQLVAEYTNWESIANINTQAELEAFLSRQ